MMETMDNNSEWCRKTILAISGSTRQCSTNLDLINSIIQLYSNKLNIRIFKGLTDIPHFNPDLDSDNPPIDVSTFRKQLREADGILICTPEYAMGVPGTLKNAIDWTVSSMELSHKPVALIVASTAGQKAHQSLMETLRILEADIPDLCSLWISHAKAKVKGDTIIDTLALAQVRKVMDSLIFTLEKTIGKNI
ncbi:MAG TPA: NAD(P)H-dependent oxidoreductase [Flavitalea sp.]|nr:NAD(P)H-dependent oxidoreductase [Flavitalea sp.]